MQMDWKKEGKGSREVVPEGTYRVNITDWEECNAKTGTPQIRWYAEIFEPKTSKGVTLVDHTALTAQALWRLATLVSACGIDLSKLPKMEVGTPAFKQVLDACKGRVTYWRVIKDEQYKNNKVEEYIRDAEQPVLEGLAEVEDGACPFKDKE